LDYVINVIIKKIKSFLKQTKCKKLIEYQKTIFKVSLSVNVENIATFDLKEISKQIQEIAPATNHAKILDDIQFLLCQEIENNTNDPEYLRTLQRFRIIIITYIARLAELLEHIKLDIHNNHLKQELRVFFYD